MGGNKPKPIFWVILLRSDLYQVKILYLIHEHSFKYWKKIHNIFIEFIKFMIGTWMEVSPIHYSGNFT